MNINGVAEQLNQSLALAGVEERWELDTDGESNSVGTWFFGGLGGVTGIREMREITSAAIKRAEEKS